MNAHNLFKPSTPLGLFNSHESKIDFSWNRLIEILLECYKDICEIEGINQQKISNFLVNTLMNALGNNIVSNEGRIQEELENGIKDLEPCHHRGNAKQALKLLFVMSYLHKKEYQGDNTDSEIRKLISMIITTLNTMNIGYVVKNSLVHMESLPRITDYNDYESVGLGGSYGSIEKNGWCTCCELLLPIFHELECLQSNNASNKENKLSL